MRPILHVGLGSLLVLLAGCQGGGKSSPAVPPPGLLGFGDATERYVQVVWRNPVPAVDSFRVERRVEQGSYEQIMVVPDDPLSMDSWFWYVTTSDADDTLLTFRVCSIQGDRRSAYGNEAAYRVPIRMPTSFSTIPDKSADGTFTGSIRLDWATECRTLDQVRIERTDASGTTRQVALLPGDATTWRDPSAPDGERVTYTLTNLKNGRSSLPYPYQTLIPVLSPVVAPVASIPGGCTLTWTSQSHQPDAFDILAWNGLGPGRDLDYSLLASVPASTSSWSDLDHSSSFMTYRVCARKDGAYGKSLPTSYVPQAAFGGIPFTATFYRLPDMFPGLVVSDAGVVFGGASAGLNNTYVQATPTGYATILALPGGQIADAPLGLDASSQPHLFLALPNGSEPDHPLLQHLVLQGGKWATESAGTAPGPGLRIGAPLVDGQGNASCIVVSGPAYAASAALLIQNGGIWKLEDPGLGVGIIDNLAACRDSAGTFAMAGTSALSFGQPITVAVRDPAGSWTRETVRPATPWVPTGPYWLGLASLGGGRFGMLVASFRGDTYQGAFWWFEREAAGGWSPGSIVLDNLGNSHAWVGLAGTADGTRVAALWDGTLLMRDAAGAWTSAAFAPVRAGTGPRSLRFTAQGRLRVLWKAGSDGSVEDQTYVLYAEP